MRHRAALGVSEQTDAIVAIVSEETGSISVAVDGLLKRHLESDTFEQLLREALLPAEVTEGKSRFRFRRKEKSDAGK